MHCARSNRLQCGAQAHVQACPEAGRVKWPLGLSVPRGAMRASQQGWRMCIGVARMWRAASLYLAIPMLPLCDGADDQLLKDSEIDVAEYANIETCLAHLVLPELCKQLVVSRETRHKVDTNVALSRREARQAGVAFATARILVVIAAEADDACPPHHRLLARRLGHQLGQSFTVFAPGLG